MYTAKSYNKHVSRCGNLTFVCCCLEEQLSYSGCQWNKHRSAPTFPTVPTVTLITLQLWSVLHHDTQTHTHTLSVCLLGAHHNAIHQQPFIHTDLTTVNKHVKTCERKKAQTLHHTTKSPSQAHTHTHTHCRVWPVSLSTHQKVPLSFDNPCPASSTGGCLPNKSCPWQELWGGGREQNRTEQNNALSPRGEPFTRGPLIKFPSHQPFLNIQQTPSSSSTFFSSPCLLIFHFPTVVIYTTSRNSLICESITRRAAARALHTQRINTPYKRQKINGTIF